MTRNSESELGATKDEVIESLREDLIDATVRGNNLAAEVERLRSELSEANADRARKDEAWGTVRSRILCLVDPACAEHDVPHVMDAVKAMDAALRDRGVA